MNKRKWTLPGPAAAVLLRAKNGAKALDDDERALRIATVVYVHMQEGADLRRAMDLIQCVAKDGLERAAELCVVRRPAAGAGT